MLLACTDRNKSKDSVEIQVSSLDPELYARNGADYVKLWVNDTLLFCDTFRVNCADSFRMKVATVHKTNIDSIKIRLQLMSLDSILFSGQRIVDTTFFYRIDSIPYITIDYYRELNRFRVLDPVKDRMYFLYD